LFKRGLLAVALLMTFRNFQFFPGMFYVQEFWLVLSLLALVVVYPAWKISKGLQFSSFEIYILTLIVAAVLLPAWGAWREFGQPLVFGVLAQREAAVIVSSLLLVNALRYRLLRPSDIEAALLLAAWGTFFLYAVMRFTLNPANFPSYYPTFVGGDGAQAFFKLPAIFILYASIYYALLGFRTRRKKYYLAAAILFIPWNGPLERTQTIGFAATLLFFLYRWRPFGQFLKTVGKACCIIIVALGLIYVANPVYLSSTSSKFSDAFNVVLTGSVVNDPSATHRLLETVTALPYIQKHPLIGNGAFSHQWQGGGEDVLGEDFYAGDIGMIGALFTVGVFGTLVFAYQFRFALRAVRNLSERTPSPLSDAAAGFLLYSAVISATQASFVFNPEVPLLFIAILVGLASERADELPRSLQAPSAIAALDMAPGQI
jgi:hypothetical protein